MRRRQLQNRLRRCQSFKSVCNISEALKCLLHKNPHGMSGKDVQVLSFTSCLDASFDTEGFGVDYFCAQFISKNPFFISYPLSACTCKTLKCRSAAKSEPDLSQNTAYKCHINHYHHEPSLLGLMALPSHNDILSGPCSPALMCTFY